MQEEVERSTCVNLENDSIIWIEIAFVVLEHDETRIRFAQCKLAAV